MKIDKKTIEELSNYLDEFGLTEIEYTDKDTKIKVSKNSISVNQQPINLSTPQSNNTIGDTGKTQNLKTGIEVTSPIIGTAYHSPEPGAKKCSETPDNHLMKPA